jgi:ribose 5-phosphate isomerase B
MESKPLKLVFGADHGGVQLKTCLVEEAKALGLDVIDVGVNEPSSVDYPDVAKRALQVWREQGGSARVVLCCGSGVGMAIVANRTPGARAVNCSDVYTATMSRKHNDANVLTLGGRVVGNGLAIEIFRAWVSTEFEKGRHEGRVAKIDA